MDDGSEIILSWFQPYQANHEMNYLEIITVIVSFMEGCPQSGQSHIIIIFLRVLSVVRASL